MSDLKLVQAQFFDYFGQNLELTSYREARKLHDRLIAFRVHLRTKFKIDVFPYYRGEGDYSWDITPGIFRDPLQSLTSTEGLQHQRIVVDDFETEVVKFGLTGLREAGFGKFAREWNLIFQAQHAGIRTSFIDWTPNVENALYFAANGENESDAKLWVLLATDDMVLGHDIENQSFYDRDPYSLSSPLLVNPPIISYPTISGRIPDQRMFRQWGRFIAPQANMANIPLNKQEWCSGLLFKFRIPSKAKNKILEYLIQVNATEDWFLGPKNAQIDDLVQSLNKRISA